MTIKGTKIDDDNYAEGPSAHDDDGERAPAMGVRMGETAAPPTATAAATATDNGLRFVVITAPDGTIVDIGDVPFTESVGDGAQRESDLIGRPVWDAPWWSGGSAAEEDERKRLARCFETLGAGGAAAQGEISVRLAKGGEAVMARFSLRALSDAAGRVTSVVLKCFQTSASGPNAPKDVSPLLAPHVRLGTGAERSAAAAGIGAGGATAARGDDVAVCRIDYPTNTVTLSGSAARIFGLGTKPLSLPRATVHALFHPEDAPKLRGLIDRYKSPSAGGSFALEHRIVMPTTGEIRWVHIHNQITFDMETGAPAVGVLTVLDVTARREAETARARLSAIIESSGDAIYAFDFGRRVISWNAGAEQLFGYSSAEMIGRDIAVILPENASDEFDAVIIPAVRQGEVIRNRGTARRRSDGTLFDALITSSPIFDDNGRPAAVSVIARDITSIKKFETDLVEARLRIRLATDISRIGIWEWNVRTGTIVWDDEMFRMYGVPPSGDSRVPYSVWRDAVHPADLARQEEILQATVEAAATGAAFLPDQARRHGRDEDHRIGRDGEARRRRPRCGMGRRDQRGRDRAAPHRTGSAARAGLHPRHPRDRSVAHLRL